MPEVRKYDPSMIKEYLGKRNLKFMIDGDGDYRVRFAYDEKTACSITVWLITSGKKNEIYVVRVNGDVRVPKSDWDRAIMLCNTWNKERRWPKAYLYVQDPMTDTDGIILLEEQIDLEKGIHEELFDDFTDTATVAAHKFLEWAHEQGLW